MLHGTERNPLQGLLHQVAGDSIYTAGSLIESDLAVRASTTWIIQQLTNIVEVGTGAQVIRNIIHHIQKLVDRSAHTQTAPLRKIDYLGIQAITHRAPFVLLKQSTRQRASPSAVLI